MKYGLLIKILNIEDKIEDKINITLGINERVNYKIKVRYSIQPRDFVKRCGFPPFAKNMGTNIGKNISKNLTGKYSQNIFIMIADKMSLS